MKYMGDYPSKRFRQTTDLTDAIFEPALLHVSCTSGTSFSLYPYWEHMSCCGSFIPYLIPVSSKWTELAWMSAGLQKWKLSCYPWFAKSIFSKIPFFIHSDGPPFVWVINLDLDGVFSLYFRAFRESLNPAPDHTLILTRNPNPDTYSYYSQ